MDKAKNVTEKSNEKKLLSEVVFYDTLDQVFSNLNHEDLKRASKVCKFWNVTAEREISRRSEIQCLVVPMFDENEFDSESENDNGQITDVQPKWNIDGLLRISPHLALLFRNDNYSDSMEIHDFYDYHERHLKDVAYIGLFEALSVTINTTEIIGNFGVGMMIPSTFRLKVDRYVTLAGDVEDNQDSMSSFVEESIQTLIPTNAEHNCFIFLLSRDDTVDTYLGSDIVYKKKFLSAFFKQFKEECEPGTYSLWGGDILYLKAESDRCSLDMNYFIRLSGPAIKSWSIVVKLNLSTMMAEHKLQNFKQSIKTQFKLRTIAIAMVPSSRNESLERKLAKTEVFRNVFPKISLLSVYQEEHSSQIGYDSINCDPEPLLQHEDSVAYLIISSD